MSTTIENQVVSMQFDNKHFESNVKTSLSTLDKLKRSLKFPGAAKGFDDISASAKKVNLSPLGGAVEKVGLKFNGMYTIADQVLRNITNRVQQTAENIVKSFTIDPIKTGFQEYETQINAVQTILANTQSKGENLQTVSRALDELNAYADMTIYNFTEMTRNIGTFTAAGVGLEDSVSAIKGIANLAAVSGSNAQQASTAMYQLSQALASGTVKLMDWNSVVNAGMGGQVFQEALKETARVHNVKIDEMIKKHGSFRETLQEGWLTSEILTETLWKFTLAGDAMTESERELATQQLKAIGYNETQIESIFQLGQTATDAATKVKTFTQLMDTMKEAAQSGWTQTWELLVGDFEQAKELWTGISNFFTGENGILTKSANTRNQILGGALKSNWDKLMDKITEAKISTADFEDAAEKALREHGYDVEALVKEYGSLEKIFRSGAVSSDVLKSALDKLKKSEIDLSTITRDLKNGLKGDDVKKIEKVLLDLGYNLTGKDGVFYGDDGYFGTLTRDAIKKFQKEHNLKVTGKVDKETLAALEKAHKAATGVGKAFSEATESVDELINGITELGGREILLESFKTIFEGIGNVLRPLGDAFNKAFGLDDPDGLSAKLYEGLEGFKKKAEEFKAWTESDEGKTFISGLTSAFGGLLSVIKLIASVVGGVFKGAFKIVSKILSTLGVDVVGLAGKLGDGITKFQEWLESSETIPKIFDGISNGISDAIGWVREWIKAFFEIPSVKKAMEDFKKEFEKIGETLSSRFGNGEFSKRFQEFIERVKAMDGISLENIKAAFSDFFNNVLGPLWKNEDGTTIFDGLINTVKDLWGKGKKYFEGAGKTLGDFGSSVSTFFSTIGEWLGKNAGGLIAIAALVGVFLTIRKLSSIITMVVEPIGQLGELAEGLQNGIKKISGALSLKLKADAAKGFATAIAILVGALIALTLVDTDKLLPAVLSLVVVMAALGGLIFVIGKWGGNNDLKGVAKLAAGVFSLSVALLAFAFAAKVIAGVDNEALIKAGIVIGSLLLITVLVSRFGAGSGDAIAAFGYMMAKLGVALLLFGAAVAIFGHMKTETLIKGGLAVGVFLLMIRGVMKTSRKLNADLPKFATTMNGLAIALLILSASVAIFGNMKTETLIQGGLAVGVFLLMMRGVMKTSRGLNADMPSFGASMIGLSVGLLAMALAVKVLSGMEIGPAIKGLAFVSVFLGMMLIMMQSAKTLTRHSRSASKVGLMILSFAASILLITGAIAILSMLDFGNVMKAVAAIAVVGLIFAGMVALTKFASADVKTTIITMASAVAILAIAIAALTFIDTNKLLAASAALGVVMGMFTLMSVAAKKLSAGSIASVIVLTGIVAVLAYVIRELAALPMDGALQAAGSIGILLLAMAGSIALIGLVSKVAVSGIVGMVVLTGIVVALSYVMKELASTDADGALKAAGAIGILLVSMAASCAILGLIGLIGPSALLGAAMLALVLVTIGAIAYGTSYMLPTIGENLSSFMENLSGFINGVKSMDASAMTGLKSLAEAILTLCSAATMFGVAKIFNDDMNAVITSFVSWLTQLLPVMSKFATDLSAEGVSINTTNLDAVVTALRQIIECAGMIPKKVNILWGAYVEVPMLEEFTEWVRDALPVIKQLALDVSARGVNINAKALTAVVSAAKVLAEAAAMAPTSTTYKGIIGYLAESSMLKESADWIAKVAPVVGELAKTVSAKGVKINEKNIVATTTAASALAAAAAKAPKKKEYSNWLLGEYVESSQLVEFGAWFALVAPTISSFATKVSSENINVGNVEAVSKAAYTLAAAAQYAPKKTEHTGLGESYVESTDLGKFAEWIKGIGTNVKDFAMGVSGIQIDVENVEAVSMAAQTLASAAKYAPTTTVYSGVKGDYVSTTDLATFAEWITTLGEDVKNFALGLSDKEINVENVEVVSKAAATLASAAKDAPTAEKYSALGCEYVKVPLLTAFTSWITEVGNAVADLSVDLSGKTIKTENVDTITGAITTIAAAAANAPTKTEFKIPGVAEYVETTDLTGFTAWIEGLKDPISEFSTKISGEDVKIDSKKIGDITTAIKDLASAAKMVPKKDGFWQDFTGTEDLSGFTKFLSNLVTPLTTLSTSVTDADIDLDAVTTVAKAGKALAEMASNIPLEGGVLQWLSGETGWDTFGTNIGNFADQIIAFSDKLGESDINLDAVAVVSEAGRAISEMALTFSAGLFDSSSFSTVLEWVPQFCEALATAFTDFSEKVSGINLESITTASTVATTIASFLKKMSGFDYESVETDKLGSKLVAIAGAMESFSEELAGIDLTPASTQIDKLTSMLKTISSDNLAGSTALKDALSEIAKGSIEAFVKEFENSGDKAKTSVEALIAIAVDQANSTTARSGFVSAGYSMAEGFAAGISSGTFLASAKASAMASVALAAAKAVLKINSPSKVFIPVGEAVPEGFALGIDNLSGMVKRSTASMADNAIEGTSNAISRIADIVNMDIDTQPTIRPVLDLSEVESGVGGINSMFGMTPSVGVMSNIRSINSMMNNRQNGANSDVVSAIKDLSGKLGNTSGDTYNVNGITYDDGSNVTNAVKELIRGVKVERRI